MPDENSSYILPHVSYSSINDWVSCGKLFQLKRVIGLAERMAWWLVGGKAVHIATEEYDRTLFAAAGI